ncbi:MAG: bifunctional 3,4-dihydroxy-2-butanone-4-phosphate synthase/GTP cyclohydrolase II [Candidatus Schekmanbacteria bacterium]|nr:bifunctional 3,4-dihydroxy-2-butanone-4-phosphate synthase/GTP cyclohydrolase II [Candidatus Schekmanbacteria bacterium]
MFDTIDDALADLRAGKLVVLVDDEDRENEGDLCVVADLVTADHINFMARYGRGLICLAMESSMIARLKLPMMAVDNTAPFKTAFTVSIDARTGISTGISAHDRARTIRLAVDPTSTDADMVVPGHVFPLRARNGGVLVRAGQTEGSVDLARLAGFSGAGVICEILNDDGTMARRDDLRRFCDQHELKLITIADLIHHRHSNERLVERTAETTLPTKYGGTFHAIVYRPIVGGPEHVALVKGEITPDKPVLVRVHSKCLTGDTLGSQRCDCGEQLHQAMAMIEKEGCGVLLYMDQEGRGIGLTNKIRAYTLQDSGMDTVDANKHLGFAPDLRDYGIGAQMLVDLGVRQMRLVTNNPRKIVGLSGYGLEVVGRVPIEVEPVGENINYLRAKRQKLGHLLSNI